MSGLSVSGVVGDIRSIPGALRLDEVASGTLYLGSAVAGSSESAPVWQIQQITFPQPGKDDTVILWADGDIKFDNIWTNRLGLSYS